MVYVHVEITGNCLWLVVNGKGPKLYEWCEDAQWEIAMTNTTVITRVMPLKCCWQEAKMCMI